jgi:hypothetical protein
MGAVETAASESWHGILGEDIASEGMKVVATYFIDALVLVIVLVSERGPQLSEKLFQRLKIRVT